VDRAPEKKAAGQKGADRMKPALQLFTANGKFWSENCKKLKVGQLSSYAKEFFRIFLKNKQEFRKPIGCAFFRLYNDMHSKLGPWPQCNWHAA
jgi:hypothetical protein